MTTGGRGRGRSQTEGSSQPSESQTSSGESSSSTELRDFKTQARAMSESDREAAFSSDEFRRLVAAAAVPTVVAEAECASHCYSHCGSHCFGHG
ncbi:MAG: hypothetical protein JWR81_4484 [Pseudonocardia sp.]|jgi:hypothetical protein|nr:hypothetical protein [Pseudonocardia sp.]MDT7617218.1 hypothetical protein [Pseudonocardiales bacterium]